MSIPPFVNRSFSPGSLLGVLASLMLLAAACSGPTSTSESSQAYVDPQDGEVAVALLPSEPLEEPAIIGLAVQNLSRTFFQGLEQGARSGADSMGAELIVTDAGDDADQQLADVAGLIDQGVHGIVLSPVDSGAAVKIAELAAAEGVPLLAVANQIGTVDDYGSQFVYPGTVALVTNDDVNMGRLAAGFAATIIGDETARVAVIEGKFGTANAVMRSDGFQAELDDLGISYEIVASSPGDWTGEGGATVCQDFAATGGIDLIFSMSDAMTAGCVEALAEADVNIDIVSIGGNDAGVQLLLDGSVVGTVCQKPGTMGSLAVETMIDSLSTAQFQQGLRFYETPVVTASNQTDVCDPQW